MSIAGQILAAVAAWIVAVISATGYLGVALLMAIESACIPLPSEVIMPFAGYLVSTGRLELFAVATAGAIGCNLGSIPAYALGRYGGRAVLIGRLLPVVRSFIAFPAGMARMPQARFHLYTFVGSWPWCFALAWAGMKLGQRWHDDPRIAAVLHKLDFVVVGAILLAGGWFVWHRLRERRAEPN